MLIAIKINFIPHFCLEILQSFCKLVTLSNLGRHCLAMPTKVNGFKLQNSLIFYLHLSSFPSFLRYCKDITNLPFLVFWACLAMTSKNITTSLQKSLMLLIFMQKIIFIPVLFLEILQRYYKLIILVTLGQLGHAHQKQWHQPVENSYDYCKQKINLIPQCFLQILHFTGSYNLRLAKNISENNSTIKLLPDIDFLVLLHLHVEHFYLFFPYFKLFLSIILSGILTSSSWL